MLKQYWQKALLVLLFIVLLFAAYGVLRPARQTSGGGETTGGKQFRLNMRDPWYTYALDGKKTVEARPNKTPFDALKSGTTIVVARSRPQGDTVEYEGQRRFDATVNRVTPYATYKDLVAKEGLDAVAPGAKTVIEAHKIFREFTDEATEKEKGVLAIAFTRA